MTWIRTLGVLVAGVVIGLVVGVLLGWWIGGCGYLGNLVYKGCARGGEIGVFAGLLVASVLVARRNQDLH